MAILDHADGNDPKMPWWNRILGTKIREADPWYPILYAISDGSPTHINLIRDTCTYTEIAMSYCMKVHNGNIS